MNHLNTGTTKYMVEIDGKKPTLIEAKDFDHVKKIILDKNPTAEIGRIVKKNDYRIYFDALYDIKKKKNE